MFKFALICTIAGVSFLLMSQPAVSLDRDWPLSEFRKIDKQRAARARKRRPAKAIRTHRLPAAPDLSARAARQQIAPLSRQTSSSSGKARQPAIVGLTFPGEDPPRAKAAHALASARKYPTWQWRILKTQWSASDERGFEEFVRQIGESRCRTMHSCLKSAKSNPAFAATNPRGMHFFADCADLPYMLRGYYAWKRGLPFSYSTAVTPLGRSRDIRYTARGNAISARRDLVATPMDARSELRRIVDTISSAHFRYPPAYTRARLPDHYPVKIDRKNIRAGTIIYDPNGHVAVVYKVSKKGRIHYIDTHPDNSLTRGIYSRKFVRALPAMGAGFKRWRPLRLIGATRRTDGSYTGGKIILARDKELPDWSDEQFYGTAKKKPRHWRKATFSLAGKRMGYYDFVRKRLAPANFRYDPLDETRSLMRALCEDIKYRVDAVDIAVQAGLHRRSQPGRLPRNIYGTDGDWETYSTPSRDARLKTSFKELRDEVARFVRLVDAGSAQVTFAGSDIRAALTELYRAEAKACVVRYTKSDGQRIALDFSDIGRRLFKLSFDPYHCPERRWGANDPKEIASCPDGKTKHAWYDAEQRLRNQLERTYAVRMDFGLAGLRAGRKGSGVDAPPNIDVLTLLRELPKVVSVGSMAHAKTMPPQIVGVAQLP